MQNFRQHCRKQYQVLHVRCSARCTSKNLKEKSNRVEVHRLSPSFQKGCPFAWSFSQIEILWYGRVAVRHCWRLSRKYEKKRYLPQSVDILVPLYMTLHTPHRSCLPSSRPVGHSNIKSSLGEGKDVRSEDQQAEEMGSIWVFEAILMYR